MNDNTPTDLYKYAKYCQHAYQDLKNIDQNQAIVQKIEAQKATVSIIKRFSITTASMFSVITILTPSS